MYPTLTPSSLLYPQARNSHSKYATGRTWFGLEAWFVRTSQWAHRVDQKGGGRNQLGLGIGVWWVSFDEVNMSVEFDCRGGRNGILHDKFGADATANTAGMKWYIYREALLLCRHFPEHSRTVDRHIFVEICGFTWYFLRNQQNKSSVKILLISVNVLLQGIHDFNLEQKQHKS